jgi:hypothetical protein
MEKHNLYLSQVWSVLPRLLSLFDNDPLSITHGIGDRYRWAWKLIDFGNGTFQGAAHGLAMLLVNGMLPEGFSEAAILRRIGAMFHGVETLRYPNGSLAEAFPFEYSFCVTALVAYDLLTAVSLLESKISASRRKEFLDTVRPMIRFLHKNDETHAFISNHLATAAVALYRWSALTGETGEKRGHEFLERILEKQSKEGWFMEYEGADPGYQSLCSHYLADLHLMRPDLGLSEPLRHSIQFIWQFAHPDGSFGGFYGSRNTRFYFPSGLEALSSEMPEAEALARFMRSSISQYNTVTLNAIDEPNLIPMFNSYCWACVLLEKSMSKYKENKKKVPSISEAVFRKHYPDAGLLIDKGEKHYTIVSLHKGGVCYHFCLDDSRYKIDSGVAAKDSKGHVYSTQAYGRNNEIHFHDDHLEITATFVKVHRELPTPFQFLVLRLLNNTLFRVEGICNFAKKSMVKYLITGKKVSKMKNIRSIRLGYNISINDQWLDNFGGFSRLNTKQPFSVIHMASMGYWQRQDDAH